MQRYNPCREDWRGHGAIEWFFSLKHDSALHRECTNFSSPNNFPQEIVKAIKAGKMAGFDCPMELLSQPARVEYEKIVQPAWDEYEKVRKQARDEYEKIRQQAFWKLFELPENRNSLWR